MKKLILLLVATMGIFCGISAQTTLTERAEAAIAKTAERQVAILQKQLDKPYPSSGFWYYEDLAFAAYHFNQKIATAEDGLVVVRNTMVNTAAGDPFWEKNAHWHVYLLARLYNMYSSKSAIPRMYKGIENYIADIMHAYLNRSEYVGEDMVDFNHIWTYEGSENHHLQAYVSAWSAAHILKDIPEYKDMKIGNTGIAEFARKFDMYFKYYFREKATKGLLTEIASPTYVKYSLNTLYNIYDFAEDEELKSLADKFLNLYFADWAIEQFNGLRGGSKHRSYTGRSSFGLSGNTGSFPFGLGTPTQHPGFTSAATTTWRPNVLVAELALAQAERGSYDITSRRPGMRTIAGGNSRSTRSDEGFLRYTYHTPQFNMGTSMVPLLNADAWVAISSQNRCNLILFSGTPAKIYTQRPTRSSGSVYNAEWGVQHKGMRILQMLPAPFSDHATGQLIFFSNTLVLQEEDTWVFAEAADAYCAVKVVKGNATFRSPTIEDYRDGVGSLSAGTYLELENAESPIVFEVSPKEDYVSYAAFKAEIKSNTLSEEGSVLTYISKAYEDTLTHYSDYSQAPKINNKTLNFNPEFVYQSPFINGNFGQSEMTISMDNKSLVLDFDNVSVIGGEDSVTICTGSSYKGWSQTGSYQTPHISSSGHDSIHITHLTVEAFKPTVVLNADTLKANEDLVSYQWHYSQGPISGATSSYYVIKWSDEYYLEATNEYGCTGVSDKEFYIYTPSSLDQMSFDESHYTISPNPTDGIFKLQFENSPPKDISLKLINTIGQVIEQREIENPTINHIEYFDVSHLKRGLYYLIISDEKNSISEKIIR